MKSMIVICNCLIFSLQGMKILSLKNLKSEIVKTPSHIVPIAISHEVCNILDSRAYATMDDNDDINKRADCLLRRLVMQEVLKISEYQLDELQEIRNSRIVRELSWQTQEIITKFIDCRIQYAQTRE